MWQSASTWKQQKQIRISCIQEIKSRLNLGNTTIHFTFFHTLSYNIKFKIYKTIILLLVTYRVPWCVTLKKNAGSGCLRTGY